MPTIYQRVSCTWILKKSFDFLFFNFRQHAEGAQRPCHHKRPKMSQHPYLRFFAKPANFIFKFLSLKISLIQTDCHRKQVLIVRSTRFHCAVMVIYQNQYINLYPLIQITFKILYTYNLHFRKRNIFQDLKVLVFRNNTLCICSNGTIYKLIVIFV